MKHPLPLAESLIARDYAVMAIVRIVQKKESLDTVLGALYQHNSLSIRDRGFAEYIIRAALKGMGRYERMCAAFLREPPASLPLPARVLLCVGCVQLHEMDVPDYAAVDSTVELAKYHRLPHLAGLMNAVLKRVATVEKEEYPVLLEDAPAWMRTRLVQDYGEEMAEQIVIASLGNITYTDITVKEPAQRGQWQEALQGAHYYGASVRVKHAGSVPQLSGFAEGAWWVQDIAAHLPVTLVQDKVAQRHVLEIGAAPGGKTMQLASYGADLLAVDRSKARLKMMQENINRTGFTISTLCADVTSAFTPPHLYDLVLLDAPCSATGTLRRHPDILFQRTEQDMVQLLAAQRALLCKAAEYVAVGGYLLYVTCSLFHEEGEAQIAWFLQQQVRWQHVPLRENSDAAQQISKEFFNAAGDYRTQPTMMREQGGMDGLYAALLRRLE
jgi:16S rRNA (cytosine967-C5)-methyltransferase